MKYHFCLQCTFVSNSTSMLGEMQYSVMFLTNKPYCQSSIFKIDKNLKYWTQNKANNWIYSWSIYNLCETLSPVYEVYFLSRGKFFITNEWLSVIKMKWFLHQYYMLQYLRNSGCSKAWNNIMAFIKATWLTQHIYWLRFVITISSWVEWWPQ